MNLIESFSEFKAGKNIDRPTMVRVMEDVFRTLIKKKYGSDEHFDIIVNTNGDLQLWRVRKIVPDGEVMDEQAQVSYSEAKSIDVSYELDEECYEELTLEDFGRRAIMAATRHRRGCRTGKQSCSRRTATATPSACTASRLMAPICAEQPTSEAAPKLPRFLGTARASCSSATHSTGTTSSRSPPLM